MEIRYLGLFPFCVVVDPYKLPTPLRSGAMEDLWPVVLTKEEAVATWWKPKNWLLEIETPAIVEYSEVFDGDVTATWDSPKIYEASDPIDLMRGYVNEIDPKFINNESDIACNDYYQQNTLINSSVSATAPISFNFFRRNFPSPGVNYEFDLYGERTLSFTISTISPFTWGNWQRGNTGLFLATKDKPDEYRMALNVTGSTSWSDQGMEMTRENLSKVQGMQTFSTKCFDPTTPAVMSGIFVAPKTQREIPFTLIQGAGDPALGLTDPAQCSLRISMDKEWQYQPV